MRTILALVAAVIFLAGFAGCGHNAGQAAQPSMTPTPTASPSPTPTSAPSPTPSPTAAQAPATRAVDFSGLPAGSYVTHLHSICNGSQNFHITVLGTLVVGGGGTGSISVSSGYFGRGLCVIVYADPALTRVLATQTI